MVVNGPGFTNGTIILKEPEAVYYSGQLLSGNVHFELTETTAYTAINVIYLGEAVVQRTEEQYEMSGGHNRYRDVNYEGREQYFNFVQCISGGVGISSLSPGVHSIPFQFQVPFHAPSSFKGEYGNIVYRITAVLENSEIGQREELVKDFQVVAPISPNTLANTMQPMELDFEEIETCNCFCVSKPINLKIVLPSKALHIGSVVPITVKVQNDSSIEIYEIYFKITERYTYRTQRPRSEYSTPVEILAELKKGPVLSNSRKEYTWHMPLPSTVLPNLESCSIMDVTYLFKVQLKMSGCNETVEDESEIFIGVLPQSETSAVMTPDLAAQLPKAPIPDPNNQPIGLITPGKNCPANTSATQRYGPQVVSTPSENAQKSPYKIGFIIPDVPIDAAALINSRYGHPRAPPSAARDTPYPHDPPSGLNLTQSNVAVVPSAPSLDEI